jgi:hypothetical protein
MNGGKGGEVKRWEQSPHHLWEIFFGFGLILEEEEEKKVHK